MKNNFNRIIHNKKILIYYLNITILIILIIYINNSSSNIGFTIIEIINFIQEEVLSLYLNISNKIERMLDFFDSLLDMIDYI
jgi:hypothetical protein